MQELTKHMRGQRPERGCDLALEWKNDALGIEYVEDQFERIAERTILIDARASRPPRGEFSDEGELNVAEIEIGLLPLQRRVRVGRLARIARAIGHRPQIADPLAERVGGKVHARP